jgi:hypothetical protein
MVPICVDRHNFATSAERRDRQFEFRGAEGSDGMRHFVAKALGKSWRFFETYADVQSSSVLKHPFSSHA